VQARHGVLGAAKLGELTAALAAADAGGPW
jgi:hypothetical protein